MFSVEGLLYSHLPLVSRVSVIRKSCLVSSEHAGIFFWADVLWKFLPLLQAYTYVHISSTDRLNNWFIVLNLLALKLNTRFLCPSCLCLNVSSTSVPDVVLFLCLLFFFWAFSSDAFSSNLGPSRDKANDYSGNCIVVFALKPRWCYLVGPMWMAVWISQSAPSWGRFSNSHPYPFTAVWV